MPNRNPIARVSFTISLEELNAQRALNGHDALDEKDFFSLISSNSIITMNTPEQLSETVTKKLSYIVIT